MMHFSETLGVLYTVYRTFYRLLYSTMSPLSQREQRTKNSVTSATVKR